jgi:ATP-dependent Clp protease ATP-binding subunit ClpC
MNSVKINFPILVQNIEVDNVKQYYLKPLFLPYPIVTHRRYERAISKMQNEVRQILKNYNLNRETLPGLMWYRFSPNLKYELIPMEFSVGKGYIKGKFGVAHFELEGLMYACLPAFNYFFFIVKKDEKGKYTVAEQAQKVIETFMRQARKDNLVIDPEDYYAQKGEFVSHIDLTLKLTPSKFKFEENDMSAFFAAMGGGSDFSGEVEIEKVGNDLNRGFPSELKRAFYREETVNRLSNIIYQKQNSPIVLLGAEGVGKKSILEEAIWRYCERHKNKVRNDYHLEKVWHIDPTRIIAGMSIVGQWQKRFESILDYVCKRRNGFSFETGNTDKILIDNIIAMLRIGKSSQNDMTLSDVMKPYLEKRLVQMILIATPEEWKVLQEKDRRFADLFQVIRVEEPSLEVAAKMIFKQKNLLELEHGCQIGVPAISQLFSIHRNYLKSRALPGGIMKILNQLAVKYKFLPIDVDEIRVEFQQLSGLGKEIFDDNYLLENEDTRQRINAKLVGQPDAVDSLVDLVNMVKAKLNTPNKPLGSFMFIGPTGVGKTQAAKVLCNYLLENEDNLMRFDMNEFIDGGAVERLIGDYYNPDGQLTGKVRFRPFGIILLDEIEKAHPTVHDLLLQVLDDGRLTDSLGRTVDFSNTIIIMTSNIGAREVDSVVGFTANESTESEIYRKSMENYFRPEFINRIDKIVIFKPLSLEHIFKIARLQINELLNRDGFVRRSTILNISPEALEWVANRGFDKRMGGRALKRQIEKDLTALSAEQLIQTDSNRPIIFEILFKNNELHPNVITLDFVAGLQKEWIPTLPTEKKGRKFYGSLLRTIEDIERELRRYEKRVGFDSDSNYNSYSFGGDADNSGDYVDDSNWMYYSFKDGLKELKEEIKEALLGFQNRFYISNPAIPLRLKRVGGDTHRKDDWGGLHRNNKMDELFQQEAMNELKENYRFNASEFDKISSQFLDNLLDVGLFKLYAEGVFNDKIDELSIDFHSYIEGLGKVQIKFLVEMYQKMLKGLDITFKLDKETNVFTLEGYNIYELLKGESGIHLFHIPHQNPLPIRVNILKIGKAITKNNTLKVIRLYNGISTITDLRTNFTNEGDISTNEFKLFLYGSFDEVRRNQLIGEVIL